MLLSRRSALPIAGRLVGGLIAAPLVLAAVYALMGVKYNPPTLSLPLVLSFVLAALVLASEYALVAVGFVIIYRATQVLNFAQGELMMLGAYLFFVIASPRAMPYALGLLIAFLASAALGGVIYLAILRPLTGQPLFAIVIVTMGLAILLRSLMQAVFGAQQLSLPAPFPNSSFRLGVPGGTFFLPYYDLAALVTTALLFLSLVLLFRYSAVGLRMRATAESPLLASQTGINVNLLYALAWAIAAFAAALAGINYATTKSLGPTLGELGLRAFPAAMVGGLDSVGGALIGALIVAGAETTAVVLYGESVKDATVFLILLLVLMVRPFGLFGSKEIERV